MSGLIWVNDRDLEDDLGLTDVSFSGLEGWGAGLAMQREVAYAPNTLGGVLGADASPQARTVKIKGILNSATVAARDAELTTLLDVFNGLVELRFGDATDKVLEGVLSSESSTSSTHPLAMGRIDVSLDILCPDPSKRDRYSRSVAFSTRTGIPLGTLVSRGIVRIMGSATNPTLTYRDSGGNAIQTMTFTVSLGATEYLEVDLGTRTITKYTAGVATDALATWTGGTPASGWIETDPADGSYSMSAWPTLEVSAGAAIYTYYRKWRS